MSIFTIIAGVIGWAIFIVMSAGLLAGIIIFFRDLFWSDESKRK